MPLTAAAAAAAADASMELAQTRSARIMRRDKMRTVPEHQASRPPHPFSPAFLAIFLCHSTRISRRKIPQRASVRYGDENDTTTALVRRWSGTPSACPWRSPRPTRRWSSCGSPASGKPGRLTWESRYYSLVACVRQARREELVANKLEFLKKGVTGTE